MFSTLGQLYSDRFCSALKIIFTAAMATLILTMGVEIYKYGEIEYGAVAEQAKMTAVFNSSVSQKQAFEFIEKLNSIKMVERCEYVSSDEAAEKFFSDYELSEELTEANPFPDIVKIVLRQEFVESRNVKLLVDKLRNSDLIEEVRYKKDFVEDLSIFKSQIFQLLGVFAAILLVFLSWGLFLSIKSEFAYPAANLIKKSGEKRELSSKRLFATWSNFVFSFFNAFCGVLIATAALILIWFFLKEEFAWLSLLRLKSIIQSGSAIFFASILVSLFSAIVVKRKY